MDFEAIKRAAEGYRPDMSRFLRDMIAIPSESCEEKGVVMRIKQELEKLGYDRVEIDQLGNVIGWMGTGEKIIAIDSHIDTVGIGNRANWTNDPYEGYETDDIIYGRGGSDQEGGMASAAYGAKIMKDLGLIPEGYKIMVGGSVQEAVSYTHLLRKWMARTLSSLLIRATGLPMRRSDCSMRSSSRSLTLCVMRGVSSPAGWADVSPASALSLIHISLLRKINANG